MIEFAKTVLLAALKDDKVLCRLTFLLVVLVACGFDLPWLASKVFNTARASVEAGCAQPAPTPWVTGTSGQ